MLPGLEFELIGEILLLALMPSQHLFALLDIPVVCQFQLFNMFHIEYYFQCFDCTLFTLS